jgi:hypothetical protein
MKNHLLYVSLSLMASCAGEPNESVTNVSVEKENMTPCTRAVPVAVIDTSVYKDVVFERISDDYAIERLSTGCVNVEIEHTGCEYYTLIYNVSFCDGVEDKGIDAAIAEMKEIAQADISPLQLQRGLDSLLAVKDRGEDITAGEHIYINRDMPAVVSVSKREGGYRFIFKMGPL